MYGVSLTSSSPPRHSAVKVDAVHDRHEIRFSRFNLNHNKLDPVDFSRNFAEFLARNLSFQLKKAADVTSYISLF